MKPARLGGVALALGVDRFAIRPDRCADAAILLSASESGELWAAAEGEAEPAEPADVGVRVRKMRAAIASTDLAAATGLTTIGERATGDAPNWSAGDGRDAGEMPLCGKHAGE